MPGVFLAGDGAGIVGAEGAEETGRIVAAAVTGEFKVLQGKPRRIRARTKHGRRFLDMAFRPQDQFRLPVGDDLVCRCEEVTAGQVRELAATLISGPNQAKALLRCGMGPCQGRLCGLTVTELIARERGISPQEVGYYRVRSPVKPVTVAEIASVPHTDSEVGKVVRIA